MNMITLLWLLGVFVLEMNNGEPVDSLRAVESLPHLVALAGDQESPIFNCLTADVTQFDGSARTFTYTWHFKGPHGPRDIPFKFEVVDPAHPDKTVSFLTSDESKAMRADAVYSDYKSCLILKVAFGSQKLCSQWVPPGAVNAVPETCSAAMKEICGDGIAVYYDATCQ